MDAPPSLLQLCVQKLAQNLIKYGPKKVRFARLSELPRRALEALLQILVAKNALNDNVLPHALTRQTQKLGLEGASQLRRYVLNTIGRLCPNLRTLDVRTCQQVDNRIVRDVLQHCERLETLRLDGCTRISDSAFAPALWGPPLVGLLGLRELSVGKCGQITAEGLLGYVMKGAPFLRTLGLSRLAITDEVASELLFSFGLESLDLSFCAQITDAPFQASPLSLLRELIVPSTQITDAAVELLAARAPHLEVFNAGLVMKLTDRGVLALVEGCSGLRTVCVRNTQITDASFDALVRCHHLEHLDASWCLRATSRAIEILGAADPRPPLRELLLDHLGALNLDMGLDMAMLPPPASPALGLWEAPSKGLMSSASSPRPLPWLTRLPSEPPSLFLPPPAQALPPLAPGLGPFGGGLFGTGEDLFQSEGAARTLSNRIWGQPQASDSPTLPHAPWTVPDPVVLQPLVTAYASLEMLLLEGIRDIAHAAALQAIADVCPTLQQLALTLPAGRDSDAALEAALREVGAKCVRLSLLRLDSSSRPHHVVVAPLAPPYFARLRSLTLWCSTKSGGLADSELEVILSGRLMLETLCLRNCEGLSEGLFPRWCNRGERLDEAEMIEQLDQALLSSLNFGCEPVTPTMSPVLQPRPRPDPPRIGHRRQHPRCPSALALRSVANFSLGGATALSDRSADALAELLHDAQTVDLRGSQLSEDALRSFRKSCRFVRSVVIVTRDRTLSWTAASSSVKRRHHRRSSFHTSGSSGTESS